MQKSSLPNALKLRTTHLADRGTETDVHSACCRLFTLFTQSTELTTVYKMENQALS